MLQSCVDSHTPFLIALPLPLLAGDPDPQCIGQDPGTPCDDGLECTHPYVCNLDGVCEGLPLSSSADCSEDGILCTSDHCDGAGSCIHTPIPDGGTCSDGNPCTECQGGNCVARPDGPTAGCDDNNVCTGDVCDNGVCISQCFPNNTECAPGKVCLTFPSGKCFCVPTPGGDGGGCGPGNHWLDDCDSAFVDLLDSTAVIEIDLNLDCSPDLQVDLTGQLVVQRSDSLDDSVFFPGFRPVDGHLDVIDVEIVAMSLTGADVELTAGGGFGADGLLEPTLGAVGEQPGNPALADTLIDVAFEIQLPGGQFLYSQTPLRVEGTIDQVPPVAQLAAFECLPLFTSPIPGEGEHVANVTLVMHNVMPPPPPIPATTHAGRILAMIALLATAAGALILRRRYAPKV